MSKLRESRGEAGERVEDYDVSRMHVVHDGPGQAPTLLLIHGTAGAVAWWNPVVPALADRHHVIRVDLPGHGESPPARSYGVADQAARVAGMLERIGVDSVIVAGHSSGGFVATALAEQRRDLVRAVVLINTGPFPAALRPQPAVVRALLTPPFSRLAWSLRSSMIARGLKTAFTRPVDIPDDLVAAVRDMSYGAFVRAPRQSSSYIAERALPDRLAALDIPVLVIFGTDDHRWDSDAAHSYEAVPSARLEMLTGIGHTPMFEAPDVTSTLLLAFATAVENPTIGFPSQEG
jgi:pimeloyl-ACP methyl ester carboxylesterase